MRSTVPPGAVFRYTRGNGCKRDIEKYLLLKPKRSYLTERSSMCAFNLRRSTDVCLQEFLNPFCEEVENAFSQPNAGIKNSWKSPSKTQKGRILQTALLGVRLPKGVESGL